jgi:hypothetical protein
MDLVKIRTNELLWGSIWYYYYYYYYYSEYKDFNVFTKPVTSLKQNLPQSVTVLHHLNYLRGDRGGAVGW